ncbi:hypothetical protein CDL15_Pgr007602 [Punica granatum]|uniref:Trichome birefringence-like C-terminal domain-containing protein n=1 Tax=Punica granatum TaxID=22663 RepID=A0A218X9I9_PUNGR|nr:hypothetical protein CDL15_Pgr007602 [Punica granatum]PKI41040.1 hypothetical protein CRG98_038568 [Punica granatum]
MPGRLLESSRNQRIAFAGDSIGRNQWESLLCMLSKGVSDLSTIYEENGSPITKHKGYLSIRFRDCNLTVEYYRAPFLVMVGRPPVNSLGHVKSTVRVDEIHPYSKEMGGCRCSSVQCRALVEPGQDCKHETLLPGERAAKYDNECARSIPEVTSSTEIMGS